MSAVPSDPEGRPIAEPPAPPPTVPARPPNRNVTPQLNAEELAAARKASYMRLFDTWNDISEKYGTVAPEEDDEVDLMTGEITCDRGRIRGLKARAFAEGVNFDFDDDGIEEEDDDALGEESDASVLPQEEEEYTPEPDPLALEEDHPMSQEQPWTAEDDRDLQEFLYVERMRRMAAGAATQHEEEVEMEPTEANGHADMDMANMGSGQMGLIAKFVRREVERMLGSPRPSPPFPHAAARVAAGRSAPRPQRPPLAARPQQRGSTPNPQPGPAKPSVAKGPVSRTPTPASSISKSSSLPNIPSALRNGSTPRPSRLSLSASKVRFADEDEDATPGPELSGAGAQTSSRKGKGRMAGERPGDNDESPVNHPTAPQETDPWAGEQPPSDQDRSRTPQRASPSPATPSESAARRRKRSVSEGYDSDLTEGRERYLPTNVYLKSLSYHDGKLRECTVCLEAAEPRSRYAALCRGRIDSVMCRFPQMTEDEIEAAIAFREAEEAAFQESKTPEARSKKRKKLAPRVSEIVTEIPTSWRPRPGDERYSMAPHRVRGGAFKRCKLCVVAGGVREKRSMFCMGRSGHGKCAFETEEPSGSSGDEDETPEQAAIKQMEHRLLRAQNARMNNMSRAFNKEETPAAPPRKSTTPYVSYRQGSMRPGLPATRGASKVLTAEDLNPRAPNGRLKPRCGPCLRAGGERAEKAFLCAGSGRPKYCEYAPGASASPLAISTLPNDGDSEEKEPLTEMGTTVETDFTPAPDSPPAEEPLAHTPAKVPSKRSRSRTPVKSTPASSKPTPSSTKAKPKKKPRRHSRLGREESSAEDYETEESEFSPEFADSDDTLDSSEDEAALVRLRRVNRESTGYRISGSDHDTSNDLIADAVVTIAADDAEGANDADDDEAPGEGGEVNRQILANVAASMDANYAPRPDSDAYAPYLSFHSGGAGWVSCAACIAAGGARALAAMWCYGREGAALCRLAPDWGGATAPPALPAGGAGPRSARNERVFSPDRGVFSPDPDVFSDHEPDRSPGGEREHSPDPLASDIEMDDVHPLFLDGGESGYESDGADSLFDAVDRVLVVPPRIASIMRASTSPKVARFSGAYRDPRPLVPSDGAPSSSPQPQPSQLSPYASPLARPSAAADAVQASLARSITRNFLAPPAPRPQQT